MPAKVLREVQHIIETEMKRGLSKQEAEKRAWGHIMNNPVMRASVLADRKKTPKVPNRMP